MRGCTGPPGRGRSRGSKVTPALHPRGAAGRQASRHHRGTVGIVNTVEVDGLRLAYRRAGHGRNVMFVHGGAQDSRSWAPQLDALSDEFTVVAWDEPGAGGSDDVPDQFSLSDYAD